MRRFINTITVGLLAIKLGACADDPELQRTGEQIPDPIADGGSSANEATGGVTGSDAVPFCEALRVLRVKCQRCHGDPPKNGAPVPFLTYADTQAQYSSTERWSDAMLDAVSKGTMPFVALNDPPTNLMPPVEPLTDEEKDTLLTWLKQGAQPVGGTDCP